VSIEFPVGRRSIGAGPEKIVPPDLGIVGFVGPLWGTQPEPVIRISIANEYPINFLIECYVPHKAVNVHSNFLLLIRLGNATFAQSIKPPSTVNV
jgi:hypothetical protein